MKNPDFNLSGFLFGNDQQSRLLWQKYQLSITPKFYAVLALLLAITTVRNILGDATYVAAALMVLMLVATTAAGFFKPEWFLQLSRLTSIAFVPLLIWIYLQWQPDLPAPCLILLPMLVLFLVFSDSLLASSMCLMFAVLLLLDSASNLSAAAAGEFELLLALGIVTGMLYVSGVLLWVLLNSMFRSRAELSDALEQSLRLRQSLLNVFFNKLSAPLDKLGKQVQRAIIAWPDLNQAAEEIKTVLVEAREVTLELGARLDLDYRDTEKELESLRDKVWMFVLIAGLVSCLLIIAVGLAGPIEIRFPEIGAALIIGLFLWIGKNRPMNDRIRLTALYLITGLIAMACMQSFVEHRQPYQILYFFVIIFCAVFISGPLHSGITALIAALFWCAWVVEYPQLEQAASYTRSNILLALLFVYTFSRIVMIWLRHSLQEISQHDLQLHQEADTRNRLMATLFHDIANPLLVIQTGAELAMDTDKYVPDLSLIRSMAGKILRLVMFTREFEEMENSGHSLPIGEVVLADLFADLQATFSNRLASKHLVLVYEKDMPPVLAHGEILGMSVFSNLLTNAIKFSPRGGRITISTEVLAGELLKINMRDEGSGLPAEVIGQLTRGEPVKSTTGTAGEYGDGQGLHLVSLYLGKMNGKLVLDPAAEIAVVLPLAAGFEKHL